MSLSKEAIDELYVLRANGWSFKRCAGHFGVTKGVIAGLCWRRKIPGVVMVSKKPQETKAKPKLRAKARAPKPPALLPEPEPMPMPMPSPSEELYNPVAALKNRDCRWPFGDPRDADFRFCCAPRSDCGPYCADHKRLAYVPSPPRLRKKLPG